MLGISRSIEFFPGRLDELAHFPLQGSTTFGDDNNPIEDVSRIENYDVILLGKQSKKWVTTFTSTKGNRLVLEEWSVPELPQLRLADSLNRALELELGKPQKFLLQTVIIRVGM